MPLLSTFGAGSVRGFGGISKLTGGGPGESAESLFSSHLYHGWGYTRTITNGVDFDGEGGLLWIKRRDTSSDHYLFDTETANINGTTSTRLKTNTTDPSSNEVNALTSFNNNGFTIGSNGAVNAGPTWSSTYISWAFRKSPKFFDIVKYTGDSNSQQVLSHNLDCDPGMVIIKSTNTAGTSWWTWHRSFGANTSSSGKQMALDANSGTRDTGTTYTGSAFDWGSTNGAYTQGSYVQGTSSTNITVGYEANLNTWEYVAYIFAHNDGDGGFGPSGDADIIKCGSYTHNYSGAEVNLGFEPQWILLKAVNQSNNWYIFDCMRGIVTGGLSGDGDAALFPNTDGAENVNTFGVDLTPTGFIVYGNNIASTGDIIYMAIRRSPMTFTTFTPDVFRVTASSSYASGFRFRSLVGPVDMAITRESDNTSDPHIGSRLTGATRGRTDSTDPYYADSDFVWDNQKDWHGSPGNNSNDFAWMWKRAPGFFDVVTYKGTGVGNRVLNHNLGVAPDMIWIKARENTGDNGWVVYHKDYPSKRFNLETSGSSNATNFTNLTSTSINLADNTTNNTVNYVGYLFASCPGVSKIGSFTQYSSARTVDCGFDTTEGAFILIKRASSSGGWDFWDTERGLGSGTEPYFEMQSNASQTNSNLIDPLTNGFSTTSSLASGDYIFYAIGKFWT